MYIQSKKVAQWKGRDYLKIISCFVGGYISLVAICLLAVFLNCGATLEAFVSYFSGNGLNRFIYLLVALLLIVFVTFLYFYNEKRDFILIPRNAVMVFTILFVSVVLSYFVGKWGNVYARPIVLCALLSLLLIDRPAAIFMNITVGFIIFLLDKYTGADYFGSYTNAEYAPLVTGFTAGLIAIYLVSGVSSRLKVLYMGLVISVPIIICTFILERMNVELIHLTVLTGISAGMLSVGFEMLLLPVFERAFNVVTDYRLAELTDHKYKPLARLIKHAPGTFNHSLIVSNLAESCASAIGESSQLARAAAYYHDIGKMYNPAYFTENQQGASPHDELTPELSAKIIMRHTAQGEEFLRKKHYPKILADVARQHQGTMPIRYFYMKACKMTDGEVDIKNFSYPGPKPQTKIAAIIMIADGCEAKVRTLKDRTHANVDKAIKEIIEERMDFDQFSDCDITIKDLDVIRSTLVNALAGVYHDRVAYPKLKLGKQHDDN